MTQEELDHQDIGYSTNNRNTAMSDMATALGMKGLLAKSTPMTLIRNGEAVHGTFMAKAEGLSFDDITPNSPIMEGKDLLIDYDSVVKDGTDMMVLDYICLNRDRHQDNHFYKISKNKKGNPVLTGLQGIDNDSSFGAYVPQEDENVSYLPPLTGIKMMKKQTADMVLGLTEARIKGILLGKGLSEDEIKACWERTKKLQEHIRKEDYVEIIEGKATKRDFEDLTDYAAFYTDDFPTPFDNIRRLRDNYKKALETFKRTHYSPDSVNTALLKKQKIERNKRINNGLKNLKNKVYVDYRMTIKSQSKEIKSLYSKLKSPKEADSKEYKEMYAAVKELNDNLKLFQKKDAKLNDHELTPDAKMNILSEQFKEVQSRIRTYVISLPKEPSPADKKRISTVNALQQVCVNASTSRQREVHQLNTLMKNAHQQIGEVYDLIKPADPKAPENQEKKIPPFERTIAEHVLQAKMHLASFVGNCEQPQKNDMPEIHKDMAVLAITNKIKSIKENNPSNYQELEKEFTADNTKLDSYIQQMLNNGDFKRIIKQTNPINALVNNTTAEVTKLAEDMNIFRNINLDTSKDPLENISLFW